MNFHFSLSRGWETKEQKEDYGEDKVVLFGSGQVVLALFWLVDPGWADEGRPGFQTCLWLWSHASHCGAP